MAIPIESTLAHLRLEEARLREGLVARNTVLGYAYDWGLFKTWAERFRLQALPATPDTLGCYLTDMLSRGHKISTARRRTCAISYTHRNSGLASPATAEVMELLRGAQRLRAEKPRQMEPLTIPQLRRISGLLLREGTPTALRNRALLVLGFATALRRSNLVALDLADVEFVEQGLLVHVNREKQDQDGRGRLIGLVPGGHRNTCPVRVLRSWLRVRGDDPGPLFPRLNTGHVGERMDGDRVCLIVKECAAAIGLDPANYGGHSLRAGLISAAAEANLSALRISAFTGQSPEMVRRYFRRSEVWEGNLSGSLDL